MAQPQVKECPRDRSERNDDVRKEQDAGVLQVEKKVIAACIESHEPNGKQPILHSNQSQSVLGLVKDMQSGQVYLKYMTII